tara:strand:+ start:72 stop:452 length:381 start_codon:yes stop_codon:yes gene_type:complete
VEQEMTLLKLLHKEQMVVMHLQLFQLMAMVAAVELLKKVLMVQILLLAEEVQVQQHVFQKVLQRTLVVEEVQVIQVELLVLLVLVEQVEQVIIHLLLLEMVLLIEAVEVEVMVRLSDLFQVLVDQA